MYEKLDIVLLPTLFVDKIIQTRIKLSITTKLMKLRMKSVSMMYVYQSIMQLNIQTKYVYLKLRLDPIPLKTFADQGPATVCPRSSVTHLM